MSATPFVAHPIRCRGTLAPKPSEFGQLVCFDPCTCSLVLLCFDRTPQGGLYRGTLSADRRHVKWTHVVTSTGVGESVDMAVLANGTTMVLSAEEETNQVTVVSTDDTVRWFDVEAEDEFDAILCLSSNLTEFAFQSGTRSYVCQGGLCTRSPCEVPGELFLGHIMQRVPLPSGKILVTSGRRITLMDATYAQSYMTVDFSKGSLGDSHVDFVAPLVVAADCGHSVIIAEHTEQQGVQFWNLDTRTDTLESLDIVGTDVSTFTDLVDLTIDNCGNLIIASEAGLYVTKLPWLSAGYSPWMQLRWEPTRSSYHRLSAEMKSVTWTLLLCSTRPAKDRPFMPLELWHCVLRWVDLCSFYFT